MTVCKRMISESNVSSKIENQVIHFSAITYFFSFLLVRCECLHLQKNRIILICYEVFHIRNRWSDTWQYRNAESYCAALNNACSLDTFNLQVVRLFSFRVNCCNKLLITSFFIKTTYVDLAVRFLFLLIIFSKSFICLWSSFCGPWWKFYFMSCTIEFIGRKWSINEACGHWWDSLCLWCSPWFKLIISHDLLP